MVNIQPAGFRLTTLGAAMLAVYPACVMAQESAVASNSETELATIHVQEQREIATADGYLGTKTRVGKTLQDPHDIPQAVTIITSKLLEEQQVGSLREALRNVSGVTFNAAEGGRSGDNISLRGFYTFGDLYLDGIRDTAQYNRETFNLERIDVLRGAAALLFGRGQAGGVINQVSKIPRLDDSSKVSGTIGTSSYVEETGDFNKKLGETTAIRLNVLNRDEGSNRRNPSSGTEAELHRAGIAVSLGFGLGTENELILSHNYTRTRDLPDYGVAFNNTTHRVNTNFSSKDFWGIDTNFDDSDTNITTASFTHVFDSGTEWRTQLRSAEYERTYWAKTPSATLAPSPIGATGGNQTRNSDYRTVAVQSDVNTKFEFLGLKHEFLTGFEFLKEDGHRRALLNVGTTGAPLFLAGVENPAAAATDFKGDTYAVFFQDTVEFIPKWKLLFGVRRDDLSARYSSTTSPQLDFAQNSKRLGLSWQPQAETHYYLSWSDSFSPTADLYQLSGAAFPPERSQVVEIGTKWLLMDGDLALRAALYRADKDWERNTDLESTAAILTKKRRTDGLELEAAGRITDEWEVFAGLALMDSRILEVAENRNAVTGVVTVADARLKGQRSRNAPPYTANLWTTYALTGNWKVGGGIEAKGRRFVYQPSTTNASSLFTNGEFNPNTAPAYARVDTLIAYEQKSYTVRLNVQNLLNKVYYDALYDNGGFAVPGTGRRALLTFEYKF